MKIEVVEGDILSVPADVAVFKFAQKQYGADRELAKALGQQNMQLAKGGHQFFTSAGKIKPAEALCLGVGPLAEFDYGNIAVFAEAALKLIAAERPAARVASITLHGPGYGLDELAAIDALVRGLRQASTAVVTDFRVVIVEIHTRRAARIREYLAAAGQADRNPGAKEQATPTAATDISNSGTYSKRLFAAMPFASRYLDHWEFALEPAAHANKLVIERLDHEQFTGEVLAEIRTRIERAHAVVAVLDENNPNVFLEVGYAWGVRKPTVLLLHASFEAPFDVKGHRMIRYSRLGELKTTLSAELKGLLSKSAI